MFKIAKSKYYSCSWCEFYGTKEDVIRHENLVHKKNELKEMKKIKK